MPGVITRFFPHFAQPQYPETIDRTNFVSDGIVREFNPASIKDAASGYNTNIVGNIAKASGTVGRSLDGVYQGSNNYINLGRPALTSNQVTLEALVLVNSFQETVSPYLSGILSSYQLSNAGPVLRFNPDAVLGNAAVPTFILSTGGGATEYRTNGTALLTGRVYHILATYDGTVATLYVNGNQVGQTSPAITFDYGAGSYFSGLSDYVDSSTTDNRCLNGKLFAGRIYAKAKTAQQAKSLANNPWQIYTPQKRRIWVAASAGSSDGLAIGSATVSGVALSRTLGAGVSIGVSATSGASLAQTLAAGSSAGVCAVSGAALSHALAGGSSSGVAAVSGSAIAQSLAVGSSVGIANASGIALAQTLSTGSSTGVAVASGVSDTVGAGSTGLSSGVATVSGIAAGQSLAVGGSSGIAATSGIASAQALGVGASVGSSTVSGASDTVGAGSVGASSGIATVSGVAAIGIISNGLSSGSAATVVIGAARSLFNGASSGTSSVTGVSGGGTLSFAPIILDSINFQNIIKDNVNFNHIVSDRLAA